MEFLSVGVGVAQQAYTFVVGRETQEIDSRNYNCNESRSGLVGSNKWPFLLTCVGILWIHSRKPLSSSLGRKYLLFVQLVLVVINSPSVSKSLVLFYFYFFVGKTVSHQNFRVSVHMHEHSLTLVVIGKNPTAVAKK